MKRYKLIVQGDVAEGREEEFLDFYPNVHIPDVLKVSGFISAQLFRRDLTLADSGEHLWKYLLIYEVETDSPENIEAIVRERARTGEIRGDPSLMAPDRRVCFYEEAIDKITGSGLTDYDFMTLGPNAPAGKI